VFVYFRIEGWPGLWRFVQAHGSSYQVAAVGGQEELLAPRGSCRIVAWKAAA
jgi:hypothetical protein